MKIKLIEPHMTEKWDLFLTKIPEHSFFHLSSWFNVLTDVYHHRLFLPASIGDNDMLTGGFPLFLIKQPVLGAKLISIPYQTAVGGPLSNDLETKQALLKSAVDLGTMHRARYIEIRGSYTGDCCTEPGFRKNNVPASLTYTDLKVVELKTIRENHRRDIKKALKNDIVITEATSLHQWKLFYELFERQQREYAAPGFGWKFFQLLHDRMKPKVMVRLAWSGKICIGGILLFHHNKTVYYKQGVMAGEFKKTGAGKLMMWDSIMWAKERNYETFNFGMSLNSNPLLISYKEGFNGTTVPVENYIYAVKGDPPKIEDLDEGYQPAKWVWRNMPLFVTKRMGALLSRWYC